MSMWINLARVSPQAFARIKDDPALLGPLLIEQDDEVLGSLGVAAADISGLDYEAAEDMIEATGGGDADDEEEADDDEDDADDDEDDEDDDEDDDDDADDDEPDDGGADATAKSADDDDDDELQGDVVLVDLGIDGTLGYDAGFGSAFFLTPGSAKQAAESSTALDLDEEAKAVVKAAGVRGDYIVGVIS